MTDVVALEELRDFLSPSIGLPLAACSPEGVPHISYISRAQYLDAERIATSRQAFNQELEGLEPNAPVQALVLDPATVQEYRLDLRFLHTATDGDAYEEMRAYFDALSSEPAFRLRGVDVHQVLRCTRVVRDRPRAGDGRALLEPLAQLTRRLERASTYEETASELLAALEDLFGFDDATLFVADDERLVAVAGTLVGSEVAPGAGLAGTAARRRRLVVGPNLTRARAVVGDEAAGEARSAAAVPLIIGSDVLGVLYLESEGATTFSGPMDGLLRIIGTQAAASLAARGARAPARARPVAAGDALELSYYQADDTVLCGSNYVVKGAPGRILWSMLTAHDRTGRTRFSNRELRLDESIGLPAGNANLEARLLLLRRRLAELDCGIALERVGRGQLELTLERPATLTEVPTEGPMRAAHNPL